MYTRTILQPTIGSEWLDLIWITFERFEEILGAKAPIALIYRQMRASVYDLRFPASPGKLRKQAIASIGAVQPTIISEWLNLHDFEAI
jgi:hypothetical protein